MSIGHSKSADSVILELCTDLSSFLVDKCVTAGNVTDYRKDVTLVHISSSSWTLKPFITSKRNAPVINQQERATPVGSLQHIWQKDVWDRRRGIQQLPMGHVCKKRKKKKALKWLHQVYQAWQHECRSKSGAEASFGDIISSCSG